MEISKLRSKLIGRACRFVIVGNVGSSRLSLHFDPLLRRNTPLHNKAVSNEFRLFRGETELFLVCSWRLSHNGVAFLSSQSVQLWDEYCVALQSLAGKSVVDVASLTWRPTDLRIAFQDQFIMDVFCDQIESGPDAFNYTITYADGDLAVGTEGVL